MTVISFPIPPYTNPPIEPQFYQPSRFVISDIIRGMTTLVTNLPAIYPQATIDNNYVIGQLVRFTIPPSFGIRQLNEVTGYVISIPGVNQVEVDIDSRFMDPFTSSSATTKPQIVAVGDINSGPINSSGRTNNQTFISGSFINISP